MESKTVKDVSMRDVRLCRSWYDVSIGKLVLLFADETKYFGDVAEIVIKNFSFVEFRNLKFSQKLVADRKFFIESDELLKSPRGGNHWQWNPDGGRWFDFSNSFGIQISLNILLERIPIFQRKNLK